MFKAIIVTLKAPKKPYKISHFYRPQNRFLFLDQREFGIR